MLLWRRKLKINEMLTYVSVFGCSMAWIWAKFTPLSDFCPVCWLKRLRFFNSLGFRTLWCFERGIRT